MPNNKLLNIYRLFDDRFYRIPDYQRGYAWDEKNLNDFWDDLISINNHEHYTGVLTLKNLSKEDLAKSCSEDGNINYENNILSKIKGEIYEVVDGQQRLTTIIILLKVILDFVEEKQFSKTNEVILLDKEDETSDIKLIKSRFLYKVNPELGFKIYKFNYSINDRAYEFFKSKIMDEEECVEIDNNFYTRNLKYAKEFFKNKLDELYASEVNIESKEQCIRKIYENVVYKLKFNEYILDKDFDVNVAFESMNNRGKELSNLELLKNRLMYLNTIISNDGVTYQCIKDEINKAWAEIYYQLGRNPNMPLKDDEYLKNHWIVYFGYSRTKGDDYKVFLFDKQFTRHPLVNNFIYNDIKDEEDMLEDIDFNCNEKLKPLTPKLIFSYVSNLKNFSKYWYYLYFPEECPFITNEIRMKLTDLGILGFMYFKPLIMVALKLLDKKQCSANEILILLQSIERFIFLMFRLSKFSQSYASSIFYGFAKTLFYEEITIQDIIKELDTKIQNDFRTEDFVDNMVKRKNYCTWNGLEYFLYCYENYIRNEKRESKLDYNLFNPIAKTVSVEHILPQNSEDIYWQQKFNGIPEERLEILKNSLGNLLLLSKRINSSLQHYSFDVKKSTIKDENTGKTIRTGYSEGSYSEQEVALKPEWNENEINSRTKKLLEFLERNWDIKFTEEEFSKLMTLQP